ncbi:MAG: molybdenum cofactor guanylyltransferase [Crocinitomicaceae bacterium]|nr:molybdenum cofactor guanylyltransferase [Crocinitomicaceae bacterium]
MNTTGIILAGGKSSRMGSDKGLLPFSGIPMIQHLIQELEQLNLPILIISNNADYKRFGYPVIEDIIKEKGPVGGIYTALTATSTEMNVILSCDAPFVKKELIKNLIDASENHDVTVSSYNNKLHPLIGVYKKSSLNTFEESLKNDQLRLREVIDLLNTNIVDFSAESIDDRMFNNINTKDELKELEI